MQICANETIKPLPEFKYVYLSPFNKGGMDKKWDIFLVHKDFFPFMAMLEP